MKYYITTLCPRKNCTPRQCTVELSSPNASWPNCVCLIMNIYATEPPLTAEGWQRDATDLNGYNGIPHIYPQTAPSTLMIPTNTPIPRP